MLLKRMPTESDLHPSVVETFVNHIPNLKVLVVSLDLLEYADSWIREFPEIALQVDTRLPHASYYLANDTSGVYSIGFK